MTTTTERPAQRRDSRRGAGPGLHRRHRRRTRHRRLSPRRPLRRGRQPMPAHGFPARPRHSQQRHSHLPTGITPDSTSPAAVHSTHSPTIVRAFPVTVTDGRVWVDPSPPEADPVERLSRRLEDGMEHNHPAGDREVRPRPQLLPCRLPDPVDYRRQVRDYLLGPRLGTGPDDDDLLGQHPPSPLPEDRPLALYQGIRQVARRVLREASPVPGRSSAHRRDPP